MRYAKTNTKKWFLFAAFAVVFCGIGLASSAHAAEYILSQEVVDPNAPADVCPNIPGTQATIPSGMQLDGSGNCYTPAPATPTAPTTPVTTDLCKNLNGTQTSLPSGYYRTSGGNCYKQPAAPAQPVDVCSNLDAIQTALPDGYYLDESNNCAVIPQPTDECPNIPGTQTAIPEGMKRDDDVCYTPQTTTTTSSFSNTTAPSETTSDSSYVQRVPGFMQPAVKSIMSIMPESFKTWLRSLPNNSAEVVPYYVFLIVVILALIPILQSIREALFARQIGLLLKREQSIAEQKDNFIALASHYLKTPLTLMNGGLETIVTSNELTTEQVEPLKIELAALDTNIGSVLQDVENSEALKHIGPPPAGPQQKSVWRSGWFWGPIVGSILLTIMANFLLAIVGGKDIGPTHTFFHFVVATVAFLILYLGVRNLYLQRKLHAESNLLVEHEKTIDEARNNFISQATIMLQESLERINQKAAVVQETSSASYFNEGHARIEAVLQKFLLLTQVQAGVDRDMEMINIQEAVDNSIVAFNAPISEKRLTVTNATSPIFVKQNRVLFSFVLNSVLDNAIKFNQEGGTISISVEPKEKLLTIKVSDNGIGIDNEKLGQLFKPFSKTTSAVEFNYEGLGFSLFLDKIIMDYTGGEISAKSDENQGTELSISTPLTNE